MSTEPTWSELPDDHLFAVAELSQTPLRPMARRTIYALIARGTLRAVVVGSRRFVSKRAITEFVRKHEISAE